MAVTWLLSLSRMTYRSQLHFKKKSVFKWTITGKTISDASVPVERERRPRLGWIRFHTRHSSLRESYRPELLSLSTRLSLLCVLRRGEEQKEEKKKERTGSRKWDETAAPAYDEASGFRFCFRSNHFPLLFIFFSYYFPIVKNKKENRVASRMCNARGCRNKILLLPGQESSSRPMSESQKKSKTKRSGREMSCVEQTGNKKKSKKDMSVRWLMGCWPRKIHPKKSHVMTLVYLATVLF